MYEIIAAQAKRSKPKLRFIHLALATIKTILPVRKI